MSFFVRFNKNRTSDDTVNLFETDGTPSITLAATDVVRFKVYRRDAATPLLDLDSNGSEITVDELGPSPGASVTLRVTQTDMASLDPGTYAGEISVVDDSDSDFIKHAETGVVFIAGTGGGDIGLS